MTDEYTNDQGRLAGSGRPFGSWPARLPGSGSGNGLRVARLGCLP